MTSPFLGRSFCLWPPVMHLGILKPPVPCEHARMRSHTHSHDTCTHMHTQPLMHTHATLMHSRDTCTHTQRSCTHGHSFTLMTHAYTRTHMTLIHIHTRHAHTTHAHTRRSCTHAHTCSHTYLYIHKSHTHTPTRTHRHTASSLPTLGGAPWLQPLSPEALAKHPSAAPRPLRDLWSPGLAQAWAHAS